jgi:hypothetical protein
MYFLVFSLFCKLHLASTHGLNPFKKSQRPTLFLVIILLLVFLQMVYNSSVFRNELFGFNVTMMSFSFYDVLFFFVDNFSFLELRRRLIMVVNVHESHTINNADFLGPSTFWQISFGSYHFRSQYSRFGIKGT